MIRDRGFDPWQGIRRLQRAQKRLADGSLGGATNLASPVAILPVAAARSMVVADPGGGGITSQINLYNSSSQSIPTGTNTALTFSATQFHVGPGLAWDGGGPNPERVEVVTPGAYLLTAMVSFDTSSAGTFRTAGFSVNNVTVGLGTDKRPPFASSPTELLPVYQTYELSAGDWIVLAVLHDAGVSVDVSGPHECVMTLLRAT